MNSTHPFKGALFYSDIKSNKINYELITQNTKTLTIEKFNSNSCPLDPQLGLLKPVPKFCSNFTSFNSNAQHSYVYSTLIKYLQEKEHKEHNEPFRVSSKAFPEQNEVFIHNFLYSSWYILIDLNVMIGHY